MKRFLESYSHALALEEAGTHVIVFQDETWTNLGTCMKESCRHDCNQNAECILYGICNHFLNLAKDDYAKARVSNRDGGKRVAISYAHTKDGILEAELDNQLQNFDQLNFKVDCPTSELLFECSNNGDYHQQFDSEKYESYLKHSLIHAFKAKYGNDKSMILVIDQAPYHTRRQGFPSQNDKKQTISMYYDKHNINQIRIKWKSIDEHNEEITFDRPLFEESSTWII